MQKYNLFNYKEIVQTQQQASLGQKAVNIRLIAMRGTGIDAYITEAKNIAATYIPALPDVFLQDAQYSFTPNTNEFSLNATWSFAGINKGRDDITVS